MAGRHATLPVMAFAWETRIPFVPWTIVPYWSIDLFYAISFFLCRQRLELDRHALRLFSAQVIAVACFLLWPLRFSFERPEIGGVFGWLFDVLLGFDKPFNQAPSLHIVLLIVLWVKFAQYLHGAWRWVLHVWALLIGVSVLTTFQHHFIDIPTGLLAGWLCVWLWPEQGTPPLRAWRTARDARRWRLARCTCWGRRAAGAGGPAARCSVVAAVAGGVAAAGGAGLCRAGYGGVPEARRWTPDDGGTLAAGAVSGCRLDQLAAVDAPCAAAGSGDGRRVAGAHSLPRLPAPLVGVVDACAELSCRAPGAAYASVPMLDLVVPRRNSCARRPRPSSGCVRRAVAGVLCVGLFAQCRQRGDLAAAQWSCHRCDAAVAIVRAARPAIVLGRSSACHHRGGKERA
jgi:membrane-associated phospholipid phosphatase